MADSGPKRGVGYWLLKHGTFTVLVSIGLLFLAAFGLIKATGFRQYHAPADSGAGVVVSSGPAAVGSTQAAAPPASAAASPAQMLADLDGDTQPVADYQAALDALGPKCTQDEAHVAALGNAGYEDLIKNGVNDETRLSVLKHLSDSIPASLGRTDCVGILSGYLVLREQG
jgi:hypothetical protein